MSFVSAYIVWIVTVPILSAFLLEIRNSAMCYLYSNESRKVLGDNTMLVLNKIHALRILN